MNYPDQVQMGAHDIKVHIHDKFIFGTTDGKHIVGKYVGRDHELHVVDDGAHKELSGETFVHELIEAANSIYQLNMDHRVIATLGVGLYQALSSGKVSFADKQAEGKSN